MSIGTSILNLMGKQDPRERLLASIVASQQQPTASVPYAAQQADPAATVAGDQQQPAQRTPQAEAYQSPEDLAGLYKDLISYSSKADSINRGIGLIGASFAHPENRAALLATMTGDSTGGIDTDPAKMIETVMAINKSKAENASRASMMAQLPMIAEKYGIDLPTAQLLFQQGKLEEFITDREKLNADPGLTYHDINGQTVVKNRKGETVETLGDKKPPELKYEKMGDGRIAVIDPTGNVVKYIGEEDPDFKVVQDSDGTSMVLDKKYNVVKRIGVPKQPTSSDTIEYDKYVTQEKEGGRTPISFGDWQVRNKKAGASNTNVEVKSVDENAFQKKSGEYFAEDYQTMRKSASNARDMMSRYDLIEKALDSGVRTGFAADTEQALRKAYQFFDPTADVEKVAGGELLTSVQNQMAAIMRNPESGMGMPGSVSDRDLQFLKEANVSMAASPTGNRDMVKVFRRMAERKIEIAKLANAYVKKHGQLDANFEDEVAAFAEANPMFEDFEVGESKPASTEDSEVQKAFDKYGIPRK